MKAHVATEGEACEPTVIKGLTEEDWEMLHDLGVSLTELDVVSTMSLETAVFALQQIELHLANVPGPLVAWQEEPEGSRWRAEKQAFAELVSRVRILTFTTLVSLGILGDLPTDEELKPAPVELPSLGIKEQQDTLRRLTAERQSHGE